MIKQTIVCLILSVCCFCSCNKNNDEPTPKVSRTILIYMEADNNLSSYATENVESILQGAANGKLNGGNLLVYIDTRNDTPQLLQIKEGKDGVMQKFAVKDYEEHNSASVEVLRQVINDVVTQFPAESYGLDISSHGTSWLPADYASMSRSIGQDGNDWMEITDLKAALPSGLFDFILFDACYMSGVEVAYELREKANYIIASPTEVIAEGFPYTQIIEDMFAGTSNAEKICQKFYSYYSNHERTPYGSVSLMNTAEISKLATITRTIINNDRELATHVSLKDVQYCDRLLGGGSPLLFDMDEYIRKLATEKQYTEFKACLAKAVPYAENTPQLFFNNGGIQSFGRLCGLSVYVMQPSYPKLNNWYTQLDWYKAVYQ